MSTKPCVVCGKPLEPVFDSWDCTQPYGGCEIQIVGAYGSLLGMGFCTGFLIGKLC